MILIDKYSSEPIYLQIYKQIAADIERGALAVGTALPSIRACAKELGVSNTTIVQAYQRLTEEGYAEARRGSGYVACNPSVKLRYPLEGFSVEYLQDFEKLTSYCTESPDGPTLEFDLAYDMADAELFPTNAWSSICREVFFSSGAKQACLYNSRQGLHSLRSQIANYATDEFGVRTIPEQVLVMPTIGNIMADIVKLFDPANTVIAMEYPGYDEAHVRLTESGFTVRELPVYPYPSWEDIEKQLEGVQLVFLTPVTQFPTNVTMPFEYRKAMVDWAKRNNAYLIDNEYGWEVPTLIGRIPSLGALDDSGRVITLGTFSNAFSPALCLSYAILPPKLMVEWLEKQGSGHPHVPWQTQAAMSAFMQAEHWQVHLRKRRTSSKRKYQAALGALSKHFGESIEVLANPNSMYVLVQTKDGRSESELVEAALKGGVRVYPTSQYWRGNPPASWRYVLVGYSGISHKAIPKSIEALAKSWLE